MHHGDADLGARIARTLPGVPMAGNRDFLVTLLKAVVLRCRVARGLGLDGLAGGYITSAAAVATEGFALLNSIPNVLHTRRSLSDKRTGRSFRFEETRLPHSLSHATTYGFHIPWIQDR